MLPRGQSTRWLCFRLAFVSLISCVATKPNILFVVIDDLGWDDVGFRSHEIKTPTVDQLAATGIVLDQYYVQDVCSPSRATFQTGRYPMHHGIVDWIPPASAYGLPLNETTMAEKMKEAGYETHAVGKWHLGFYKWEMTPTFRGFKSFYGFYSGGEDYFKHSSGGAYDFRRDEGERCGKNCSMVEAPALGKYSTTLFSERAVQVVNSHDPSQGRPLFLYLAYQAVHSPAQVPPQYTEQYNISIPDSKRRTFAGMLSCMDEGLNNVTEALKANHDMYDNTIVVFTTDNGGPTTTGDGVGARNWPLRGGKHSIFEGGTRGTALISGPAAALTKRGYTFTHLMHGADWLPTLAEVAGYNLNGTQPLDGRSQWKALLQGNDFVPAARDGFVYGNSTNTCKGLQCGFGIRKGDWKYVRGGLGIPNTWCNTTAKGPVCAPMPTPMPLLPTVGAVGAGGCTMKQGVCFPGSDVTSFIANSSTVCCDRCKQTQGCAGWTFNAAVSQQGAMVPNGLPGSGSAGKQKTKMCFLKKKLEPSKAYQSNECISGTSSGSTPVPPVPVPVPTPDPSGLPTHHLFNVVADPTEHHELSASHPEVVQNMSALLDGVLANDYTEYQLDPNCPAPKTKPVDPTVGPYWEPWC